MNAPAILHLVADEIRRHSRAPWALACLVVLVSAGSVSIVLGTRALAEEETAYSDHLQARVQAQLHTKGLLPGRSPEASLRVVRPPNQGTLLVQGHERSLPAAWEIGPSGAEAFPPYSTVSRGLEPGDAWDQDVLLRGVGGLFAMALGLVTVFRDRASGWSAALRGLPISATALSLARITGGLLTLAAITAVWWAVVATILINGSEAQPSALDLVLLAATSLAFLGVMFGTGICLGGLARSTFQGVLAGVIVWFTFAVAAPTVSLLVAELALPLPSRANLDRERRERFADDMVAVEQSVGSAVADRVPESLTGERRVNYAAGVFAELEPKWTEGTRAAREQSEGLERDWQVRRQRRHRLARWLSWLTPGAVTREVLADLAGTGRTQSERWEAAVHDYQHAVNVALFDDRPAVNLRIPLGGSEYPMNFDRHLPRSLSQLPRFDPPDLTIGRRVSAATSDVLVLGIWLGASLGAAFVVGARRVTKV